MSSTITSAFKGQSEHSVVRPDTSNLVVFRILYEKEKLNERIADLADRFKVAILYGYGEYDSQSEKVQDKTIKLLLLQLPRITSLSYQKFCS